MNAQIEENGNTGMAAQNLRGEDRNRQIVKVSGVGILANVFLSVLKFVVGTISGSIAISMDAVNNLSDAASSVITIIGTKLASKPADRQHPFGHGRAEYLSALIISLLVLYAGFTSLRESVSKILHPEELSYTGVTLGIVAAGVLVKILLGQYVSRSGKRLHSDSLKNSGSDALMDAVISASTLAAAAIYLEWNISLEAWLGAVISLVIVKSGVDMARETLSEILGERADADLARRIRKTVMSFPEVSGVYDLVLNNYGPDSYNGSLHVEIPDTMEADQIDQLLREITVAVYKEESVLLTAIGIYSVNTKDPETVAVRKQIQDMVFEDPNVLQMHGFYLEKQKKEIRFDLVIGFDTKDRGAVSRKAAEKVKQAFPGYRVSVVMDTDYSDVSESEEE